MEEYSIAVLLEFGFHDIKKFIHSGLAKKFSERINVLWLAIDKGNLEFEEYFKSTGHPLIYFQQGEFRQNAFSIERMNDIIRNYWMVNKEIGTFHNYKKVRKKSVRSRLIGNGLLKYWFERKALKTVKDQYYSPAIEKIFKDYNVRFLIGTNYGSAFSKNAYVTANRIGISTFFLVGSWKDLYINDFIPFDFLEGIFVWSEQMKSSYLDHMHYLDRKKVIVSGNPTFDLLKTAKAKLDRQYYSVKYGIPLEATWLLYTMMPPGLVNDEIQTIILSANHILKSFNSKELVLIVRRNPNHSADDFVEIELPDNLIIADHYCTYDKQKDMLVQTSEGESEWIDLLNHCAGNLSVPSTVSLEFLTLNKPVLNIGYGPDGNPDERIRQHFKAGFYRPILENNLVMKVYYIEDLMESIEQLILKTKQSRSNDYNNMQYDLASDHILKYIIKE
jgi:hypothetical protein